MTVSYAIDPWDPGYGVAFGEELDGGALEESSAELDLDLETPRAQWRPVDPDPAVVRPGTNAVSTAAGDTVNTRISGPSTRASDNAIVSSAAFDPP